MESSDSPSLRLPPLRGLATLTPTALLECIDYLRVLYTPAVRGSRIKRRISATRAAYNSPATAGPVLPDLDHTEALRSDNFERTYTIRWLTYLINNAELLHGDSNDVDTVVERASALLANCGGTSGAGIINRVFDFPSAHGHTGITLRDIPLENSDFSSVGAQTWGVLELGAGPGLVGLMLAKMADNIGREFTVVSSDFYPDVLQNLAVNIAANFPAPSRPITSHFLDWSSFSRESPQPLLPPFDEPFDVIIGADIVYEPEHAAWIHSCVSKLLARTELSQFHLVIPLRPTHALESSSVETVFRGRSRDAPTPGLTIVAKEAIVCDVEGSANEEVEYLYYRIGWDFPA
ncbi:hypothetical protein DFH09DRAFT_1260843 [Mycena vulgaris]|nr:hypothetical protein DFH09DRAFT_1260843 [Mycena vulgaris]